MDERGMRYFVGAGSGELREVSREEYIHAERSAGFRPKYGDGIATESFSNGCVSGRVEYPKENA